MGIQEPLPEGAQARVPEAGLWSSESSDIGGVQCRPGLGPDIDLDLKTNILILWWSQFACGVFEGAFENSLRAENPSTRFVHSYGTWDYGP